MRVLLDACILFPTVMREVLMGAADAGAFTPLWSEKILAEWRHTASKISEEAALFADAEILTLKTKWPEAMMIVSDDDITHLSLPDVNDRHVLAAAIKGQAEVLLTNNLRDFPRRTLARDDILLREPDSFLMDFIDDAQINLPEVVANVQARAVSASGREQPIRTLLKRARLPRLGKNLAEHPRFVG